MLSTAIGTVWISNKMHCIYCNRNITNPGSLVSHEMSCIENPNKVKHRRSEHTGRKLGCVGHNKGKKVGRAPHWDTKYPLDVVLTEHSTYPRHRIKQRIIDNNLLEYKCAMCGIGPVWMEKPMVLIMDHINGVNDDNRLENLRFVCSNCDSQLDTYKSKNKRRKLEKLAESA